MYEREREREGGREGEVGMDGGREREVEMDGGRERGRWSRTEIGSE